MALYTRRQLLVLLLLVATAGGGLAVGHWRRENPDTVDYLERLGARRIFDLNEF